MYVLIGLCFFICLCLIVCILLVIDWATIGLEKVSNIKLTNEKRFIRVLKPRHKIRAIQTKLPHRDGLESHVARKNP